MGATTRLCSKPALDLLETGACTAYVDVGAAGDGVVVIRLLGLKARTNYCGYAGRVKRR